MLLAQEEELAGELRGCTPRWKACWRGPNLDDPLAFLPDNAEHLRAAIAETLRIRAQL